MRVGGKDMARRPQEATPHAPPRPQEQLAMDVNGVAYPAWAPGPLAGPRSGARGKEKALRSTWLLEAVMVVGKGWTCRIYPCSRGQPLRS